MKERGEGGVGTVLSIVALVAIGAFMYWLYTQSSQIEETPPPMDETGEEILLGAADLASSPGGSVGRRAELDSIAVASGLGQGVFTVRLNDTLAYPVLMNPDAIQRLRAANVSSLYGGDVVYVGGRVYTLNDSIRAAWVEGGAVDEGMAGDLPASPSFVLADSVVVY